MPPAFASGIGECHGGDHFVLIFLDFEQEESYFFSFPPAALERVAGSILKLECRHRFRHGFLATF